MTPFLEYYHECLHKPGRVNHFPADVIRPVLESHICKKNVVVV